MTKGKVSLEDMFPNILQLQSRPIDQERPKSFYFDYEDLERRTLAIYAEALSKHGIPITVDNIITAMKESPMFLHDERETNLERIQEIAERDNKKG